MTLADPARKPSVQVAPLAAAYERLSAVTGGYLRPGGLALTRRGVALCAFAPGDRLLDLGCGPGGTLAWLRAHGFACLGLDRSRSQLGRSGPGAPLLEADFARIPLRDASLDGIVCECALSQARDKGAVLAECHRVLRPGARLLISDLVRRVANADTVCAVSGGAKPGAAAPAGEGSEGPCAVGAMAPQALVRLLKRNGFLLRRKEDHTRLLRDLAARLVWEYGSPEAFAGLKGSGGHLPGGGVCRSSPAIRWDYFLFIAEKTRSTGL